MSRHDASAQLGFDALLSAAEADNRARQFERDTGHLPGTMDAALPFYRGLIERHHAAMLAADVDEAMRLRREAGILALRVNGGDAGILAGPDAPGCVLECETAAAPGAVPLWGQTGDFLIAVDSMRVRIELDGIFGVAAGACFWPGFAARAVDLNRPFLSETGYRSFVGIYAEPAPGLMPDDFAREVIAAHIARALKGRPVAIATPYREKGAS